MPYLIGIGFNITKLTEKKRKQIEKTTKTYAKTQIVSNTDIKVYDLKPMSQTKTMLNVDEDLLIGL